MSDHDTFEAELARKLWSLRLSKVEKLSYCYTARRREELIQHALDSLRYMINRVPPEIGLEIDGQSAKFDTIHNIWLSMDWHSLYMRAIAQHVLGTTFETLTVEIKRTGIFRWILLKPEPDTIDRWVLEIAEEIRNKGSFHPLSIDHFWRENPPSAGSGPLDARSYEHLAAELMSHLRLLPLVRIDADDAYRSGRAAELHSYLLDCIQSMLDRLSVVVSISDLTVNADELYTEVCADGIRCTNKVVVCGMRIETPPVAIGRHRLHAWTVVPPEDAVVTNWIEEVRRKCQGRPH